MSFRAFALQFAVLYAPFLHGATEQVTPNLYRGSDPKVKDIYVLHNKGIKTIISVRINPEKRKQVLCKKLNMEWVNIPTGVFSTPTYAQLDEFRAIVNDPKRQPCYTSCEVDMDRTGVYIAAYRLVDLNWSIQQVQDEFVQHHKKRWWPVFNKYEPLVINYAEKHGRHFDEDSLVKPSKKKHQSHDD